MDALTDILKSLRLKSNLYYRTELTAPWGLEVPAHGSVARFHIVIRGQCWLQIEGQDEKTAMSHGDIVIVPKGTAHALTDTPSTPAKGMEDIIEEINYQGGPLVYGGGGSACSLICGEFAFDGLESHPLLDNLPSILNVTSNESYDTRWLDSAISFMAYEANNSQAGANAIIDRLAEIIFIQVLRATLAKKGESIPFLAAFTDPQMSKTLSAIHSDPATQWSVEMLGEIANMSRSVFSNRFTELVKMTPLQYVIFVRLQRACTLLVQSKDSLSTIAQAIGYQSEAAFSLAFKRSYGVRPGEFRRRYTD